MFAELIFYTLFGVTVCYAFYKWATANNQYFEKRNLEHFKPRFLFGNTLGLFMNRYRPVDYIHALYNRFPNEKMVGFFDVREPVYFVRDIDILRQMTIKDFDNFEDHVAFIESDSDALFGKSLFMLSEKKWRQMRATLSPAFTSSKMRHMFDLVVECAEDMAKHLIDESKQGKSVRWEMKEFFSRYTSDVIASCAFGLKVNSLQDRTNEFFTIGSSSFDLGSIKLAIRLILIRTFPKLMRAIEFEFFSAKTKRFFKSMVLDTMKERQKNQIIRPDMINILMQVRSGKLKYQEDETGNDDAGFATVQESSIGKLQVNRNWTDDEIVAQCFLFFAAGFETSSTLLTFMAYELAIHQEIQQKVYEEIRNANATLNSVRISYNTLSKLKYLDQVISEALRKWSPVLVTNRKCTKDFEFDYDGKKFTIERGRAIWVPVIAIHLDPNNFENPEKFDPERFSNEYKHKIKPGSYLPFGIGPRNCIGSRFALMEVKALFFYLLLNFNIQSYEKTDIPVKIAKSAANWSTENGMHLEFKPRANM